MTTKTASAHNVKQPSAERFSRIPAGTLPERPGRRYRRPGGNHPAPVRAATLPFGATVTPGDWGMTPQTIAAGFARRGV